MGAKQKLNAANLLGCLLVAGLVGGMTSSLMVFVLAFSGLLIVNVVSGDIRR